MSVVDVPESVDRVWRETRVKSDILMPKGRPLSEAQHPLHLLYAIHDALLGIAAYAEAGMVHCDISAYNILLVDPTVHYMGYGGWNKSVKESLGDLVWNCTASELLPPTPKGTTETTEPGQSPREKYVENLKRGPLGVSSDAEFSVKERRPPSKVHRDRTGTPAFISAQLLMDPPAGQPSVARTFIHDIESLLWVLIWMTAHHEPSKMNIDARDFVQELSRHDLRKLGKFKYNTILAYQALESKVLKLNNTWSNDLAPVIQELAEFLFHFIYATEPTAKQQRKDPTMVAAFQKHKELTSLTRWEVFAYVLGIFTESIEELAEKYQLDPGRR